MKEYVNAALGRPLDAADDGGFEFTAMWRRLVPAHRRQQERAARAAATMAAERAEVGRADREWSARCYGVNSQFSVGFPSGTDTALVSALARALGIPGRAWGGPGWIVQTEAEAVRLAAVLVAAGISARALTETGEMVYDQWSPRGRTERRIIAA